MRDAQGAVNDCTTRLSEIDACTSYRWAHVGTTDQRSDRRRSRETFLRQAAPDAYTRLAHALRPRDRAPAPRRRPRGSPTGIRGSGGRPSRAGWRASSRGRGGAGGRARTERRVGRGLADPASPIAVRMWTRGKAPVDRALFQERVGRAVALRPRALRRRRTTTAYRVLHGEGDRMPGFVVDRYGPVAVLRTDGDGAAARVERPGRRAGTDAGVVGRVDARSPYRRQGRDAAPRRPPRRRRRRDTVTVKEHGLSFVVDLKHGQKTGAFLDQRENRASRRASWRGAARAQPLLVRGGLLRSSPRRGGAAARDERRRGRGGARDGAGELPRVGPRSAPARVRDGRRVRVPRDARASRRERWDLVISDPPSFAPEREGRAARARRVPRAARARAPPSSRPGALLCAASCSSHVGTDAFLTTLDDAALGRDDLRVARDCAARAPTTRRSPAFPEGRYLKFVVLARSYSGEDRLVGQRLHRLARARRDEAERIEDAPLLRRHRRERAHELRLAQVDLLAAARVVLDLQRQLVRVRAAARDLRHRRRDGRRRRARRPACPGRSRRRRRPRA